MPYSCGMAALACTALAMLMEVLEMTSVWKKLAMLLRKGSDCAATLPDLSLKAYMGQTANLQETPSLRNNGEQAWDGCRPHVGAATTPALKGGWHSRRPSVCTLP